MAYILRSLAVIGVIALNSPTHDARSDQNEPREPASATARRTELRKSAAGTAASSLTAAREAAEILAGLDPDTRQRLLTMTLGHVTGSIGAKSLAASVHGETRR